MTTRTEIIVNYVETGASATSAADTLAASINSGQQRFDLVNSLGQVVAAVVGAIPILKPITLQFNTFAGTGTFLKLIVDINDGNSISPGDVLNLVGNIAGLVGTVAFLAGSAPIIPLVASGVAIATGIASLLTGDNAKVVYDFSKGLFEQNWPTQPIGDMGDLWLDKNGNYKRYDDIITDTNNGFGMIVIRHDRTGCEYELVEGEPPPPPDEEVDGDGMY